MESDFLMIETFRTRLIPFTEEHYAAIFANDNVRLGTLLYIPTPASWTEFSEAQEALPVLYEFFKMLKGDHRWGSYFIVSKEEKVLLGTCGYKGMPGTDHFVEIGYEINAAHQNKGYATEAAKALIEFAAAQNITGIRAHTLPEKNASCQVLERCNFSFVGEVIDPDDGLVWKWELFAPTPA